MSTTEKATMAKGLAWRIAVAFETVDPYSFNDAYDNTREAAFCMLELLEEDPETILDDLTEWSIDAYDSKLKKALSALRSEVAEYMNA